MKHLPKKNLGQHFIINTDNCSRMAKCANINSKSVILEIGPGLGALTVEILKNNPKAAILIEKDKDLENKILKILEKYNNKKLLIRNALHVKISEILDQYGFDGSKIIIISNLPYNVSVKLISNWMKELEFIEDIFVLVQSEVANRICGSHNTSSYGKLSVFIQNLCEVRKIFSLPGTAFYPNTKVNSTFIHLKPKTILPTEEEINMIYNITTATFLHRRKLVRNSLINFLKNYDIKDTNLWKKYLNSKLRAENISVEEYKTLAKSLIDYISNLKG